MKLIEDNTCIRFNDTVFAGEPYFTIEEGTITRYVEGNELNDTVKAMKSFCVMQRVY